MSDKPLKVDLEEMKEQANQLQTALDAFREFATTPFSSEIKMLQGMNTDFIAQLVTMLENENGSNAKMVTSVEKIQELTEKVVKNFEKRDKEGAQSMGVIK